VDIVDRIIDLVRKVIKEPGSPVVNLVDGTYVGPMGADANLSSVVVGPNTFNYVRKLEHVTLVAGDTVMMVRDGSHPLTIIGVVVGDITLA